MEMEDGENICMRLNEFEKNVKLFWQELQIENDLHDVTLVCEDKSIKTHKIIISFYSKVLKNMLKLNQNAPHPLIYLRGVKYKDLENLIHFMYQGEVNIAERDLDSFMDVAENLEIRGLLENKKEAYNLNGENSQKSYHQNKFSPFKGQIKEEIIKELNCIDSFKNQNNNSNQLLSEENQRTNELKDKNINKVNSGGDEAQINNIESNAQVHEAQDEKQMNDSEDETQINDAEVDAPINDVESGQDIKGSPTIYAKISRGPDKKDGRPVFLISCPMCEMVISDLVGHVKLSHKDTDWRGIKTPCPYEDCDKIVVDIHNHIRKVHLKIRNYGCDLCEAKFSHRGEVQKHMNGVHSDIREKCPHCDLLLKVTSLKIHITNVHEGRANLKRVLCTDNDCTKTFVCRTDMERHVSNIHMNVRFPCPDCGKSLRQHALANHIKTQHEEIYPFICEQCDKGYQFHKDLDTHIRTKHNRNFVFCDIINSSGKTCGKKLRNEQALLKHVEKIHLK